MRVVLPLVSAAQNISGVQRYAINAAACLLKRSEVSCLHLIAGKWQQYVVDALPEDALQDSRLKVEFTSAGNSVLQRNLWYYETLPQLSVARDADIVQLAYPVPVRRSAYRARVAATLHDLYPYDLPENFGFPKVVFNRAILRQCLKAVDAIVCVSKSTQQRLDGLEPLLAFTRSVTISNTVERCEAPAAVPNLLREEERFLLCVAQHRRNKNVLLLLQSYLHLLNTKQLTADMRLVVVGIQGPETRTIQGFIEQHQLQQSVVLLAGISEGELQWCYEHCSVLLSPSSVEGFGLPVAEGLLAGCRIVCSDIAAHREVGGSFCRYVPITQSFVVDFGAAIVQEMAAPRPQPRTLPQLSAAFAGQQYIRLYQSLLQGEFPAAGTYPIDTLRAEERELEV